jgi:hypothetical protein
MGNDRRLAARTLVSLALAGALGACGSGGGGSDVSFSFASAAATLAESDGPTDVQVVLHTVLPALVEDATVEVADAGSGTATSGTDYAAFATQTITFPIGSTDGATQVVVLDPLDDSLVDGASETVRLRLQNATGGGIAGPSQFTATLTDLHSASVAFATGGATTPDEATGPQAVALELDCGPGVTLGVAASVRVSDLRTGSAVPPGDYSAFAAQTVTFPLGSADGAVQTVNVQVQDDASAEGDETVELGLSAPSAACTLGAIQTHVLTIQDDEPIGPALFAASEGASGTENPLAYDELVPLGSQAVGAGPNAGTLVRVANGGGQAMELGAPELSGSHPNDFAVEVESSSLGTGPMDGGAALPAPLEVLAPLAFVAEASGPGIALELVPEEVALLRAREQAALQGLVLPGLGAVTLELRRRPLPLAPDARLVIDGREVPGGVRTLVGDLQLWSGPVAGIAGSRAFLAFHGTTVEGFVELPGTADRLVHVLADGPGRVRLLSEPVLAALGAEPPPDFCAGELFAPGAGIQGLAHEDPGPPSTSALTVSDCRLALETDFQLFQKFNSSVLLSNYVTAQIGAISDQYVEDVQTTLSIAYLGIHTGANDGWSTQETAGGDALDLLEEFRAAWGTSWPAQADLAHFLSGANLGGGVAYLDVLCNQSFGFGVSANLTGTVNWLTWTGQPGNFTWDFVVVAHELGHNFGSLHTHSYCPPLDQCYTNCNGPTQCPRGTLMSYCHLCGGMSNIDLYFHPVTADIMRGNVNSSCLGAAALQPGDFVQYRVRFNPLTTTGVRSATLQFAHDASNALQPFRVQLSGTAN